MKSVFNIFAVSLVVLSVNSALAGTGKFNSDDFNSIISESLKSEADLREQLRANAGVPDLKKELNPNFAEKGRRLVGTIEAENVAAPSSDYKQVKNDRTEKRVFEKSLKRVSQEIRDLEKSE